MKLFELKEIMDMLNPECEVVVRAPTVETKRPIGFDTSPTKEVTKDEIERVRQDPSVPQE